MIPPVDQQYRYLPYAPLSKAPLPGSRCSCSAMKSCTVCSESQYHPPFMAFIVPPGNRYFVPLCQCNIFPYIPKCQLSLSSENIKYYVFLHPVYVENATICHGSHVKRFLKRSLCSSALYMRKYKVSVGSIYIKILTKVNFLLAIYAKKSSKVIICDKDRGPSKVYIFKLFNIFQRSLSSTIFHQLLKRSPC